ncbi:MAG: hypothetical protein HY260_08055, partial [Chloroflexi bacterium]|nr:hypothetical protein [Chloroflexota bacterium]
EGFDLAAQSPVLDFIPSAAEEREQLIDIDEQSRLAIRNTEQLTLKLVFREKAFDIHRLVAWLDKHYRRPYFNQKEKRDYFTAVVNHLITKLGNDALTDLTHYRFALLSKLAEHINNLVEAHARKTLYSLKGGGRLASAGEVADDLPDSILPYPVHTDTFQRHLFTRAGKMNREEADFAEKLDALSSVRWWYRNRERQDFGLQGWWGVFYPDFLAKTNSGAYLAFEPKGGYLVTAADAERKEELGKMWEEVSDGQCRFRLVTQENVDEVLGAIAGL